MNRIALTATTALALLAFACAPQAGAAPEAADAQARAKATAPIDIAAQLSADTARVTVRFQAAAKDVRVEVRGTEGLVVTSDSVPVEDASFDAGAATTLEVAFTPGPGRSHLSVAVSGKFRGVGRQGTVKTFTLGEATPKQREATGTVVEGGGARIKVVPGQ